MTLPGPAAPPRRRRAGTVPLAAAAVVTALLVGIPVGVLTHSSTDTAPTPAPTSAAPVPPTTAAAPAVPTPESTPAGLSGTELALWHEMPMPGVDRTTCGSYAPGEAVAGAAASLTCRLTDRSMSHPIIFYKFTGSAAVSSYLTMRAETITRQGSCSEGDEYSGVWTGTDGATRGSIDCVDNPKDGTVYFKIVWTGTSGDTAAVIQEPSASTTWAWWLANGGEQFSS